MLTLTPISFRESCEFIKNFHRHLKPPVGCKFCVAISDESKVRGVVIVGRPVARNADDGWTLEVTRCCTDGVKNGCSMLYAASWKVAKNLGYHKLITYTLKTETGSSLKAAGWKVIGETKGGEWTRKSRPRVAAQCPQQKLKWEAQ